MCVRLAFLLILFSLPLPLEATNHPDRQREKHAREATADPPQTIMDIINVSSWIRGDGYHEPVIGSSWNGTFPRGTAGLRV